MEHKLVICDCHSVDHQLVFTHDDDEDFDPFVSVSMHLNIKRPWYRRVLIAIKYAFGWQGPYGAWHEVLLNKQQCQDLSKYFDDRARSFAKWETENAESAN